MLPTALRVKAGIMFMLRVYPVAPTVLEDEARETDKFDAEKFKRLANNEFVLAAPDTEKRVILID